MTEASASGPEYTFHEPDGPGFLYVSFFDGGATLGCSTFLPPVSCFRSAIEASMSSKRMFRFMTKGEIHLTTQVRDVAEPWLESFPIEDTFTVFEFLANWVKRSRSEHIIAARMDLWPWSWQWDDFSSNQLSYNTSFGGLVDLSAQDGPHSIEEDISALVNAVSRVAGGWVTDQKDLFDQAFKFLARDATEYQRRYF